MNFEIEVIRRESCFSGFFNVARYRLRHSLFTGGWSSVIARERTEYLNAVAALLYDPVRDQVIMVEQFRIGAMEQGRCAWTLEPVGGVLNEGEDPRDVARREAIEEAGREIQKLEYIGTYHVSPGVAADRVRLYCACVNAVGAGGIHGREDEEEETRVVVIDAKRLIGEVFSGRIDTSSAIIGVQWLALNRERLRVEWNR
jgi:ADP-ribose pyrophosphatase